jgi:hypothetical protein
MLFAVTNLISTADAVAVATVRKVVSDGTLRELLAENHLSYADAGRAVGVPASTVMRWTRGSMPRWEHAVALGNLLLELVGAR